MVVDFDDFYPGNDRLDLLERLKNANPLFRCTLFAVPGLGSDAFWDSVPEWCELAVHGWMHPDPYEAQHWTREEAMDVLLAAPSRFVEGFKAPGWQISDGTYQAIMALGWWCADHPMNDARRPDGLRTHVVYDGDHWHGHIQDWGSNGLAESWNDLVPRVESATGFELISDVVAPWRRGSATAASAPVFTADWSGSRHYWQSMFDDLTLTGKPELRFLEVGCFEGRATLWMLNNVLTDTSAAITVVDTFAGNPEFAGMGIDGDSRARFEANLADHIAAGKVEILQGDSKAVLAGLPAAQRFHFIYVDGSHHASDVLTDATLAWPLLHRGGVLAFDDYEWGLERPEAERPRLGIDEFLAAHADELAIRHQDYQVAVEKL